jgi:hypothetical protein
MICNRLGSNECDDATSPKVPDKTGYELVPIAWVPVVRWSVQVTNQSPALEESGDEVMRWANQVLRHSWVTASELISSRPMGVQGNKIHNRLWIGEFVKIIKLGIITWALQTPTKPEKSPQLGI